MGLADIASQWWRSAQALLAAHTALGSVCLRAFCCRSPTVLATLLLLLRLAYGRLSRTWQWSNNILLQVDAIDPDAIAAHGGVFEAEAALFGAFKQEWSLKLAKALGAAFGRASDRYRRTLEPFAGAEELAR